MVNFTNDDILLYIHNELRAEKATALEQALQNDWSLKERYESLSSTQRIVANAGFVSPSQRVLSNIMAYAKESVSEKVV